MISAAGAELRKRIATSGGAQTTSYPETTSYLRRAIIKKITQEKALDTYLPREEKGEVKWGTTSKSTLKNRLKSLIRPNMY